MMAPPPRGILVVDLMLQTKPEPSSALDARWVSEALRLYRRYELEIVEAHDFCPWAARVRLDGRLAERVMLQTDEADLAPSLATLNALGPGVDLALFIYPRLELAKEPFERFTARSREAEVARKPAGEAPFVMVAFHPDATANLEESERLIPFLRRTPDPTIQVVRSKVLDKVRGPIAEGTQFMDPLQMTDTWQPQGRSLRERIADANLATVLRVGLETVKQQLDEIARDRRETYVRLREGLL